MQSLTKSKEQGLEKVQLKEQTELLMLSLTSEDKFVKLQTLSSLSLEKAMGGDQLSFVKTVRGEIDTAKLIYAQLNDLRVALGVESSAEMDELLIAAAFRILKEFWFMKFDEVVLCIHGCKEGKYGKSYGKLTMEKLFEWFAEYDRQRTVLCDQDHTTAKNSTGYSQGDRSPVPTFEKSIFEKTVDDAVEKRIKQYKKKRKE